MRDKVEQLQADIESGVAELVDGDDWVAMATRSWRRAVSVAADNFWVRPRANHSCAARASVGCGGAVWRRGLTPPAYP
jgi:hypothetical protein